MNSHSSQAVSTPSATAISALPSGGEMVKDMCSEFSATCSQVAARNASEINVDMLILGDSMKKMQGGFGMGFGFGLGMFH